MSKPQLSIHVRSFAAEDPGTWQPLFDSARVADEAGVDRLVLSDHIVFGPRSEVRPAASSRPGPTGTGSNR